AESCARENCRRPPCATSGKTCSLPSSTTPPVFRSPRASSIRISASCCRRSLPPPPWPSRLSASSATPCVCTSRRRERGGGRKYAICRSLIKPARANRAFKKNPQSFLSRELPFERMEISHAVRTRDRCGFDSCPPHAGSAWPRQERPRTENQRATGVIVVLSFLPAGRRRFMDRPSLPGTRRNATTAAQVRDAQDGSRDTLSAIPAEQLHPAHPRQSVRRRRGILRALD